MPQRSDAFDLARLRLSSGEGRRIDLDVPPEPFTFGGQTYAPDEPLVPVRLDVSRMTGGGDALRLRLSAALTGPCMRCLDPAALRVQVEAREVDLPGGGQELSSPYVRDEVLEVADWVRDAVALAMPAQVLCRADCAGLCPVCGENLNTAGPEHGHEPEPDPRRAKLRELKLD